MKVRIKTISETTGFSPATVSNALNHKKGVNQETASAIFQKAQELGYFEDNKISKIKFVIYKKIGLVVENSPFFELMMAGAEAECRNLGMEMTLVYLDERRDDFKTQFAALCDAKDSAVILLGTEMEDRDIYLIRELKMPLVVIDYWNSDMSFNAVMIDNADSVRQAVRYLIGLGHRKIGYLKGNFRIRPFRSREKGYRDALLGAGIPYDEKYTVLLRPDMDGAYHDMERYLSGKPELPTAFISDNDMIGLGAMKAMFESGVRIPQDVSIIGFDDLPYSSMAYPPLTTVFVPKEEIGRVAVRRLNNIINGGDMNALKIEVCTTFRNRSSVKDLRQKQD